MTRDEYTLNMRNDISWLATSLTQQQIVESKFTDAEVRYIKKSLMNLLSYIDLKIS